MDYPDSYCNYVLCGWYNQVLPEADSGPYRFQSSTTLGSDNILTATVLAATSSTVTSLDTHIAAYMDGVSVSVPNPQIRW
jgi:hypothetical protein